LRAAVAAIALATVAVLLPAAPAMAVDAVPGAPTGVTVAAQDSALEVTWSAATATPSVSGYDAIAYSAATDGTAVAACTTTTATNCTISGLTNGTTYYVAVDAKNSVGTGIESSPRVAATAGGKPTAPRTVVVSRILNGLTVAWLAPSSDGGLTITGYTANAYSSTSLTADPVASCTSTGLTCSITGLTSATTYYVSVQATNAAGTGPATTRVTVNAGSAPEAPRSVKVTRGNGLAVVSWSAPASNGGSAINRYVVRAFRAPDGGDPVATCEPLSLFRLTCPVGPLPNGTTYFIEVLAYNALAEGVPSSPRISIVPATVPGTPRTVTAARIGPNVHVQWTVPESDGGLVIDSYVATAYRSPSGGSSVGSCTTKGDQCDIPGLTGAPVYVEVIARTGAGDSPASTPRIKVRLVDQADPPTAVAGSARPQGVAVTWQPPLDDGGLPVTSYLASAFSSPTGGTATSTCTLPVTKENADEAAPGSKARVGCTIRDLTKGTLYYLEVGSTNEFGTSVTQTRTAVRVRPGTPLPPRSVEGFPADHRIKVNWQVPAADGGEPILGYRVQAWTKEKDGRVLNNCTVPANEVDSEFTCTLLVAFDFEPYWVEVAAETKSGWGQSSARIHLEANPAVPPPPERVDLAPRDLGLAVRWEAPSYDGGYPVYNYVAHAYDVPTGGSPIAQCSVQVPPRTSSTATTPTTCTIAGLKEDQFVYVDVTAENTVGVSVPSDRESDAIVPGRPVQPANPQAKRDKRGLVVSWTAPAASAAMPLTGYRVRAYLAAGGALLGECTSTTTTTCTITAPEALNATLVTVAAENSAGWSDPLLVSKITKESATTKDPTSAKG